MARATRRGRWNSRHVEGLPRERSWRSLALALSVLWASAACGHAHAQATTYRVEGIAAVVGEIGADQTIILLSDVDLRARMHLAGRSEGDALPLGPLPRDLMIATLDELVGETLIAMEAARVQIGDPSERDIARERARLATLAGGPARLSELLAALGVDPSEVELAALRRASVAVFLVANLDASVPSDPEVERVYDTGRHPFADLPLEDARELLRAYLMQSRLETAVARWVTTLRQRVSVRVHPDFERVDS
ncbi:MAG: hypothetical protein KC593_01940 [Myxococcales bacterium]|nr:hypothetical protein [Myxococcales bacterium]MCB9627710.1 hypothetical protein [Sandaracinaceae bacterium]